MTSAKELREGIKALVGTDLITFHVIMFLASKGLCVEADEAVFHHGYFRKVVPLSELIKEDH